MADGRDHLRLDLNRRLLLQAALFSRLRRPERAEFALVISSDRINGTLVIFDHQHRDGATRYLQPTRRESFDSTNHQRNLMRSGTGLYVSK